jgi:hypothetical protein
LIVLVVVILVLAAAAAAFKLKGDNVADSSADGPHAFQVDARPYFFSVAENKFYGLLSEACRDLDLLVFPKVGLNDVFKDKQGADRKQYFRYAQLHIDYLLVTAKDYRPVAGIELDGASHQGEKQKGRDEKKNAVFKASGLPLLRFYNQTPHTADAIRTKLRDVLELARVSI